MRILLLILSIALSALLFVINIFEVSPIMIDYSLKGFEKVLDGTLTLTSIVLGFMVAILSILLSAKDSEIMKMIMESRHKKELKDHFLLSLWSGGILVLASFILYIAKNYQGVFVEVSFYFWVAISLFFVLSIIGILKTLMDLLFILNDSPASKTPKGNHVEDPEERRRREEKLNE